MRNKRTGIVLAIALAISLVLPVNLVAFATDSGKADDGKKDQIEIIFTHDMHSHVEKFPRLKTVVDKEIRDGKEPFVLDAGDFAMGTPYQTIFSTQASELRMMGQIGFDATTLGNHEFDYRPYGLASMLNAARNSGEKVPDLLIANIDWKSTLGDEKLKENGKILKKAMDDYGSKPYKVYKKGGHKIAVFGIFGKQAASYAPESGTIFLDPVETAKKVVDDIKKKEKGIDLIVCISHSGTNKDPKKSEDEILAKEVEGLDLVVSGHSHTFLEKPIEIGDCYVASCGQYNADVGIIDFAKKDGKMKMSSYKLVPLNDKVPEDVAMRNTVLKYKGVVDDEFFSKFGYKWEQVLAHNNVEFTHIDDFGQEQGEDPLGNLFADSYIYGVKQAEGKDYQTVDVAVAPAGVIRGSFPKGDITAADAYNALSLGCGKDKKPGYPLVSVYMTGKELKLIPEIDISVSPLMQPARLYMAGLSFKYNPHRPILDKAYDIKLDRGNGKYEEIENDKLYRVVADLYSAQMLGTVNTMSKGILSLVPKDKDGKEVKDYEDQIIYQKDGRELKEWYALASYIDSFKDKEVPAYYEKADNRKILVDSRNPIEILKSPNKFFFMLVGIIVVVILIIVLIVKFIRKLVRKRKINKY